MSMLPVPVVGVKLPHCLVHDPPLFQGLLCRRHVCERDVDLTCCCRFCTRCCAEKCGHQPVEIVAPSPAEGRHDAQAMPATGKTRREGRA